MLYDFKVSLDVYNIFLEDNEKVDREYLDNINSKYDEFRIRYNDNPDIDNSYYLIEMLEGTSADNQILLLGIKDGIEYILCYWFVGTEDELDNYNYYNGIKVFDVIKEYEIK